MKRALNTSQHLLRQSIKRPASPPATLTPKEKQVLEFILTTASKDKNFFDMGAPTHMRSENETRLTIERLKRLADKKSKAEEITPKERIVLRFLLSEVSARSNFFNTLVNSKSNEVKSENDALMAVNRLHKLLKPTKS